MKKPLSKEDLLRILYTDPNDVTGALPVPPLSTEEIEIRDIAIATLQLARDEGWRPSMAQKAGKMRGIQQLETKYRRWSALAEVWQTLPQASQEHPFSGKTLKTIQKFILSRAPKVPASFSAIKKDIIELGLHKPKEIS